jgi:glycosyltransferase involved in cell wall biosynthesis
LDDVVKFLGFLDREEQLQIMNHARAIVQPSFFEGWSTVIEDAMAMNKCVIASNLQVNQEQLGDRGYFFSPLDFQELAEILRNMSYRKIQIEYDYDKKKRDFANDILKAFSID